MENQEATIKKVPTKDEALIKRIYEEFSDMRDVMNKPYAYFNGRTPIQFWDDSEKRFNSYVPSKKSQGKEKWQANFFHPTTRNKTMAILASVSLDIPPIRITAVNEKNEVNTKVANIVYNLVKASYNNTNKEEDNFFEALESITKGTVITYDGYSRTKAKRKEITSFDPVTSEIEYREKEVIIDKGCQEQLVSLPNFFVYSAFIRRLQDQPAICWVKYLNKKDFEFEFSNYSNFSQVRQGKELVEDEVKESFFYDEWASRTKDIPYEVVRYYSKVTDEHIIIANGVLLFNGPMLLGKGEKYYPFSKSGYAPFSGNFFWMNSLPNTLMGEQDIINAFYNMATDKAFKSLVTNLLIGNTNKDDFDLEDETVTLDSKIYVQDINQVKEMPNSGVSASDFNMIKLISAGLDLSSVDGSQQGVQGAGVTAREVVIANENARKLKGIFYLFITSLWLQKMRLRTLNTLTYATLARTKLIIGDKEVEQFKKIIAENVELSNGKKGNMGITVVDTKDDLPSVEEVDRNVAEYKEINPGVEYEERFVSAEYLKEWEYKIKIVAEDVYQRDSSYSMSKNETKLMTIAKLFPEFFQKNKEKLFKDTLTSFGEETDEYDLNLAPPQQQPGKGEALPPGEPPAAGEAVVEGTEVEGLPPLTETTNI